MVLEGLERQLRLDRFTESYEVPERLYIEHIMPQAWHPNWPLPQNVDAIEATEIRDRKIHTLGNLTLVSKRLNESLSNSKWEKKRKVLDENTTLFLNRRLLIDANDTWDENTIDARGRRLLDKFVELWPHGEACLKF